MFRCNPDLVVRSDDDAFARGVVLRPAGASKDLHDVQDAEVDKRTALCIVQLRALDDDRVRGQVDTPRQRCGAHEHFDVAIAEELASASSPPGARKKT